jgi:succinate-semialdehyde dehydrogenase/glutarate-semialdehyde dehydrogenase
VTETADNPTTLLAGQWQDPETRIDVRNPADGGVVGDIGVGGAHDAEAAVGVAASAFGDWSRTTARYRADLLREAAGLLADRAGPIAALLAAEAGKRLPEAAGEVAFAGEYLRWFAEEARRPSGQLFPNEQPGLRHLTVHRPIGVVLSLTPWNFPVSIQARKLAAALAAGCTVVARVSQKAPLAAVELVRCLHDAGLPPGVLNLVHGPAEELTATMLAHPAVRAVSFTGSTEVGRRIMAQAGRRIVRPLLELGGDAPFVVFDDADLDAAVDGAMIAKFRNAGQSCIGANRFLVQDGVYDEFVGRLTARIDAMSIGDGSAQPVPDLGPLIDDGRVRAVESLVEQALKAGARKLTREFDLPAIGSYTAPALLENVPDDAGLAREEVFGPAAAVFRFRDEAAALERANATATDTGLAGYVYSTDAARMLRVGERLEVGIIGFNNALPSVAFAPMGGVKQSGLGREGARAGMEEFTDTRYMAIGGVA